MHENDQLKCVFGCDADNKLEHYSNCHTLWAILDEAFGGNLGPSPFARVNFEQPTPIQYSLIEAAIEIYHALEVGQRTLVDECLSTRRFAPCISIATIIASDCARRV